MSDNDSDNDLMAAFYSGDEAAFEKLFRRWQESLLRLFRRLGWILQDADDMVIETFVKVHGTKGGSNRYDTAQPFANWLFAIARNLAKDRHRRGKRRIQTVPFPPNVPVSTSAKKVDQVAWDIKECLETLDERELAFISLWEKGLGDLSQTEIARKLGCANATTSGIKQRALEKLRNCLEGKGYHDQTSTPGEAAGDEKEV